MSTLTLEVDDRTLVHLREQADGAGVSINHFAGQLLGRAVQSGQPNLTNRDALDELDRLLDAVSGDSSGWKWNRDELYEE